MSGDYHMIVDIENHNGKLARNTDSMAILNIDKSALVRDKQHKCKIEREQKVEAEINNIKYELSDIRKMLVNIMDHVSNKEVKKVNG